MIKTIKLLPGILALLVLAIPVLGKARVDKVLINTCWDENYFYAAFEVSDPDIQGQQTRPNKPVGDDDAVALYFQADRARDAHVGPHSFRMLVSAAGGCEFDEGKDGTWTAKSITTFKYAVQRFGSLNDDQDDDTGYAVEVAIPWSEMGVTADIGTSLLFNADVQMKGEHTGFVSLGKNVQTAADRDNPGQWMELWLRGPVQPLAVRSAARVLCNKTMSRAPVIDGRIMASEYSTKGLLEVDKPSILTARRVFRDVPVEDLIFGYWHMEMPESQAAFTHRPFGGYGPWFDETRTDWNLQQIRDARRAGIDVILPQWDADTPANQMRLQALSAAAREAARVDGDVPQIGLCLTGAAADAVKTLDSLEPLWKLVSGFYSRVWPSCRAEVRMPHSRGGQPALPVFVRGSLPLTAGIRTEMDRRAQAQFGRSLLWIAQAESGQAVDAFLPAPFGQNAWAVSEGGWIKLGAVTPGIPGGSPARGGSPILDPNFDATYTQAWSALTDAKPDWVVMDSFNGWADGNELAASSEYGLLYLDDSAIQTSRRNGRLAWSARYLTASVPPIISSKYLSTARISVRNVGTQVWKATAGIRLGYRWYQNGRLYSQGLTQVPIQSEVGINSAVTLSVGVIAVDQDKDPLADGDWLLVFDMMNPDGRFFSNGGDHPFAVPVKVGTPAAFAWSALDSTVEPVLTPGETANFSVTVRNEGSANWAPNTVSAKVTAFLSEGGPGGRKLLGTSTVPVATAAEAGRVVEIPVTLTIDKAAGEVSLPTSIDIQVAFAQATPGQPGAESAVESFPAMLATQARGVSLTPPDKPVTGHEYGTPTKFPIRVTNRGSSAWGKARLVARWYSLDGKLLVKEGGEARLRRDVKPGETVDAEATTIAPPYPGQYVVQWSLQMGDEDTQTEALGGRTDSVYTQYVTVKGPALAFADLKALLDVDVFGAIVPASGPGMDVSGTSYASETVPPLVVPNPAPSPLYPVGLFGDDPAGGPDFGGVSSWRWVSFSWPTRQTNGKNAVTAKGQEVALPAGPALRVHVLAASGKGAKQAEFELAYQDTRQKLTAKVGDWGAAADGDIVAFRAPYRRDASGTQAKPAYLYDVALKADPARTLSGVRLPNDADVKVLAITVERPLPAEPKKK